MAFSRTWNTAYEQSPADTDQAKQGALRIRDLKVDVRERSEIDHEWDDPTDGGFHKKATLIEQATDPATVANRGILYSKDVAAVTELFYRNSSGNVVQVTNGTVLNETIIPSGTIMLFQQTAAPTGWTKITTQNDKSLRVVSGTAGSGGATAFSTVFGAGKVTGSHVLALSEIPAHDHPATNLNVGSGTDTVSGVQEAGQFGGAVPVATASRGGGGGHTHTLSLDLQFLDVILASKD